MKRLHRKPGAEEANMAKSTQGKMFAALVAGAAITVATLRPAAGEMTAGAAPASCATWEARYTVNGTLHIANTTMGAGDGYFRVGPGTLVLRVDATTGRAALTGFELHERFALRPSAPLWSATVATDAWARFAPDARGADGPGWLSGDGVLHWSGPLRSYRSDGSILCDGSLCGKFGAPASGRTELHTLTPQVQLQPLQFDADRATFQMDYALVSESSSPRQKTYLALAGRRTDRICLQKLDTDGASSPTATR
jgi:hypothetical protein